MLGFKRPKMVRESEAEGEVDRIFHEVRQALRSSGVGLSFRVLAPHERFFPLFWEGLKPLVSTVAFEEAADRLRTRAVELALGLSGVGAVGRVRLGPSQSHQLAAALSAHHYVDPKLLLIIAGTASALEGDGISRAGAGRAPESLRPRRFTPGVPPNMVPLEMVTEDPDLPRVREIFADARRTFGTDWVPDELRTLALWPGYLEAAWANLALAHDRAPFRRAAGELRTEARAEARGLLEPLIVTRQRVQDLGEDGDAVLGTVATLERTLPISTLSVALLALEWQAPDVLSRSPFPIGGSRALEAERRLS